MTVHDRYTARAAWRAAHPMARRDRPTAIVHNGSAQTIFACICGARHSTSTDWHGRDALHVDKWRAEHDGCFEIWHDAQSPRD